ncbi:hypothetical protein GCM10010252_26890 [Streptomyces aureoverticillatus]|nr:hypothetical protein GCM10010252_26890 [Streptomyces aureoverticillatus]
MEAFDPGRSPALDVERADADGTARRVDDVDTCPWCAQLQEADASDQQSLDQERGLPAPWVVPPGLPPRLAGTVW